MYILLGGMHCFALLISVLIVNLQVSVTVAVMSGKIVGDNSYIGWRDNLLKQQ